MHIPMHAPHLHHCAQSLTLNQALGELRSDCSLNPPNPGMYPLGHSAVYSVSQPDEGQPVVCQSCKPSPPPPSHGTRSGCSRLPCNASRLTQGHTPVGEWKQTQEVASVLENWSKWNWKGACVCEGCVCVGVLAYYRYVDKWFGYPSILQIVSCGAMSWAFPDIGSSRQTLFSSLTLYTHMHTHAQLCMLSSFGSCLSLFHLCRSSLQHRTVISDIQHRCVILTTYFLRFCLPFTNCHLTKPLLPQIIDCQTCCLIMRINTLID